MNTADLLRVAAARVRQGWCQHELSDGNGNVCAVGAVSETVLGDSDPEQSLWTSHLSEIRPAINAMAIATGRHFTPGGCSEHTLGRLCRCAYVTVVDWNNAPDQTAENVAAGLEYAALIWEQEQQHTAAPSAAESLVPCNRS